MRTALKASLILAALFVAVPACGSDSGGSSDALVGQWAGKCVATKDRDGTPVGDDSSVKFRFSQDGKFSQSIEGPDGGKLEGSYAVAAQTLKLEAEGESVDTSYSIKDEVLTTKTHADADGAPVTSTCTMSRSSEG